MGPSQTTNTFHCHETNTIYIYIYIKLKIVKCWLRIQGFYLINHHRMTEKSQRSHRLVMKTHQKKLWFTGSYGYGWKGLKVLGSKLAELTWNLPKMAEKRLERQWLHCSMRPVGDAYGFVRCRGLASTDQRPLNSMTRRVYSGEAWTTTIWGPLWMGERKRMMLNQWDLLPLILIGPSFNN